jgi:hypothetical protein
MRLEESVVRLSYFLKSVVDEGHTDWRLRLLHLIEYLPRKSRFLLDPDRPAVIELRSDEDLADLRLEVALDNELEHPLRLFLSNHRYPDSSRAISSRAIELKVDGAVFGVRDAVG